MTNLCRCAKPAIARLTYVWDVDGSEEGRSDWQCREHLEYALNIWEALKNSAPEAVAGLKVLVTA